jgi:hypothetical protein
MVINVGNMADRNEETHFVWEPRARKGFCDLQSYEDLPTVLVSLGMAKEVTH